MKYRYLIKIKVNLVKRNNELNTFLEEINNVMFSFGFYEKIGIESDYVSHFTSDRELTEYDIKIIHEVYNKIPGFKVQDIISLGICTG